MHGSYVHEGAVVARRRCFPVLLLLFAGQIGVAADPPDIGVTANGGNSTPFRLSSGTSPAKFHDAETSDAYPYSFGDAACLSVEAFGKRHLFMVDTGCDLSVFDECFRTQLGTVLETTTGRTTEG